MNTSHNEETLCLSFFFSRLRRPVTSSFSAFCSRSVQRSNCYMVCGADAVGPSSSSRSNSDLEIGCLIDLATGLVSFTANGKELSTTYQVNYNHTAGTNAGQPASLTALCACHYFLLLSSILGPCSSTLSSLTITWRDWELVNDK